MADVVYAGATCHYAGNSAPAVSGLDLAIRDGEFMVLVGPSGSGKTTALRMLAGLENLTSGEIRIGGVDISDKQPKDRDIAMVFQNYALYPHMTVAENMGFALKLRRMQKAERRAKVTETARLLDLEQYLQRRPSALSGGQRQRVAMGRAIVREPSVFLMDEPLSNLDAKLRVETRANIAELQSRLGTTTVYVTHDQVEAMTMGHRVAVLHNGILQQVDTPRSLYDRPGNAFVAGFIGSPGMNLRQARLTDGNAEVGGLAVALQPAAAAVAASSGLGEITLGLRPESLTIADAAESTARLRLSLVEELGADAYVYGHLLTDEPTAKHLIVRCDVKPTPKSGDIVPVGVRPNEEHVFHPETGERLG
jgi:multiple sugar transport system ATP-binding protein